MPTRRGTVYQSTQTRIQTNQQVIMALNFTVQDSLLNPNKKEDKAVMMKLIEPPETGLSLKESESKSILKCLRGLAQQTNLDSVVQVFISGEKISILENTDRISSASQIAEYNRSKEGVWGYNQADAVASNGNDEFACTTVSVAGDFALPDDPQNNPALSRASIAVDRRTRNQILYLFLAKLIDSSDLKRLIDKNKKVLLVRNSDSDDRIMHDGSVLMFLVLQKVMPSTKSKIQNIKDTLSKMNLKDHSDDVEALTDLFDEKVKEILNMGGVIDEDVKYLLNALVTSSNEEFNNQIKTMRLNYLGGADITLDKLISDASQMYKNMKAASLWEVQDEKSIKMAALMTRNDNLEKLLKVFHTNVPSNSNSGKKSNDIQAWRYTKTQDKLEKDGQTWYWCPHQSHKQNQNATSTGMYCLTHGIGHDMDHDAYHASRKGNRSKGNTDNKSKSDKNSSDQQISLNDKLKSALMSNTSLTDDELTRFAEGN
jgi:cell division protein ZapA (FtsZ GTPase activity inhibitor)